MIRFNNLPNIAINNTRPAFYDVESTTVLQLVDKLYAYCQNLIDNYNAFATDIRNELTTFEKTNNKEFCDFKKCIMDLQSNFIESVDTKIDLQNAKIDDAITYMKDNIVETITELINQAIEEGTIQYTINYDPETEEITLPMTGNVGL